MLNRIKTFFKTTLLGGVIIILPVVILILVFKWLFGMVFDAIQPLAKLAENSIPLPEENKQYIAPVIALAVIVIACFLFGLFVKTRLGLMIYSAFEHSFLSKAPGYKMIKETVNQLLGKKTSPFSSVALVDVFGNGTLVTAFITDRHENGMVTVFAPTGPNPTTGFIYHVKAENVYPVSVPVEDTMRSVISCGAGSEMLMKALPPKT